VTWRFESVFGRVQAEVDAGLSCRLRPFLVNFSRSHPFRSLIVTVTSLALRQVSPQLGFDQADGTGLAWLTVGRDQRLQQLLSASRDCLSGFATNSGARASRSEALRWLARHLLALGGKRNDHGTRAGTEIDFTSRAGYLLRYRRTQIIRVRAAGAFDHTALAMDPLHDEVMNTFAKRLKAARETAGHGTAKNFATILGVDEDRYRHWERGTAQPSLTMVVRICRYLRVEPNYLLPAALPKSKNAA